TTRFLLTAYCLLPTAYCYLPPAYCSLRRLGAARIGDARAAARGLFSGRAARVGGRRAWRAVGDGGWRRALARVAAPDRGRAARRVLRGRSDGLARMRAQHVRVADHRRAGAARLSAED